MEKDISFNDRDIECVLYKRPKSKFWYTRFQFNKQQYRFSTKTDDVQKGKKFTYDVIERLQKDMEGGGVRRSPVTLTTDTTGMTFQQLFNSFVVFKKGKVSEGSLNDYHTHGKSLLLFFGEWELSRFEQYGMELYGDYLLFRNNPVNREKYQYFERDGKIHKGRKLPETLSGRTLNCECMLLHSILSFGKYDHGLFRKWEIPKFSRYRRPEDHKITCPTQDEYQKMKDYWLPLDEKFTGGKSIYDQKSSHYRPIINLWMRLQTNTGMRPSEMYNLKLSDIEDGNNGKILWIRKRKNKISSGKTIDTHFPITDRIEPFIKEILEITHHSREFLKGSGDRELIKESEYLLLDPHTNRRLGDFKKTWETMLVRLGLEDKGYTIKTLRKVFITKMVKQSSIPLSLLANLIGHTNINTLQKHYLTLRSDDLKHGLERGYMEIENKKNNPIIKV